MVPSKRVELLCSLPGLGCSGHPISAFADNRLSDGHAIFVHGYYFEQHCLSRYFSRFDNFLAVLLPFGCFLFRLVFLINAVCMAVIPAQVISLVGLFQAFQNIFSA